MLLEVLRSGSSPVRKITESLRVAPPAAASSISETRLGYRRICTRWARRYWTTAFTLRSSKSRVLLAAPYLSSMGPLGAPPPAMEVSPGWIREQYQQLRSVPG